MAGIGFLLRKLAAQDNFSGLIRAYFHSTLAAAGPWIFIVISIGSVNFLTYTFFGLSEIEDFHSIIIYDFVFSFILAAPIYMVSARYVADCLYAKDLSPLPGILIASLIFVLILTLPVATVLYFFYAHLSPALIILSVVNFILFSQTWVTTLYLGCIRNFRAITASWIAGMILTIICINILGKDYGSAGMMLGVNIGFTLVLFGLTASGLAEYPYSFKIPEKFRYYFHRYKGLFWSGFFLFAGMWVDKVIMWCAPEAVIHDNNLRTFPVYDGGMFFSYLTIIPVLALFVFSLETNFYISYFRYIQHIERNSPFSIIEEEKKNIIKEITTNGRSYMMLQGSIAFVVILLAPQIFDWIGLDFLQLEIFRFGVLGAFFAALNLFVFIFLSYFDAQKPMVVASVTLFATNVILTLICLNLGFAYYGLGFCLSMILTFGLGAIMLVRLLNNLTYHVFISNVVKNHEINTSCQVKDVM